MSICQNLMVVNSIDTNSKLQCNKIFKVARKDGRYKIWEAKLLKEGQRAFLRSLDVKGAISVVGDNGQEMEFLVEGSRSLLVEKLLKERDIMYEVAGCDNGTNLASNDPLRKSPLRRYGFNKPGALNAWKVLKDQIINWNDFFPLSSIYAWMDDLEKQFPATCTVCSIGKTVEGRLIKVLASKLTDVPSLMGAYNTHCIKYLCAQVSGSSERFVMCVDISVSQSIRTLNFILVCTECQMLKISNSDASNTGAWLDGCIHAREWISVSAVTYIAEFILRNFSTLPDNITNKDWYFLPVANPDGYHYTHTVDRLWRKSRSRFGDTIVGVDLNRNFGFHWGQCGTDGNSANGDPNHQNYRGIAAFSEPESSAIKDIILYSGTPFKIFISFHSCSEVISFPWCHTSDPCPDYVNLLEGGAAMAKAIYETTGRMYKVGNFKDIMYSATGTSLDWSYGTARIPFSYLIELRSREHRFILPKDEIIDCCKEALAAVITLTEFADSRKCLNCTIFENKAH